MPQVNPALALRALAHPVRQRLMMRLAEGGPATSAMLAEEFGEDRGAMSYHLRLMARYGFIEVEAERGREKFWRVIPQDLRIPDGTELGPEAALAAEEAGRQMLERNLAALARYWRERDSFGVWAQAAMISYSGLRLSPEELARFGEEYVTFLRRWTRPAGQAPPGARPVRVLFAAFPSPDEPLVRRPAPGEDGGTNP
jgi:DNA-binding transcriptional ArsR family regulator